jgi:hypothetical protein
MSMQQMTFGAASLDTGEPVTRWAVAGMTRAFGVESNGAKLKHL